MKCQAPAFFCCLNIMMYFPTVCDLKKTEPPPGARKPKVGMDCRCRRSGTREIRNPLPSLLQTSRWGFSACLRVCLHNQTQVSLGVIPFHIQNLLQIENGFCDFGSRFVATLCNAVHLVGHGGGFLEGGGPLCRRRSSAGLATAIVATLQVACSVVV